MMNNQPCLIICPLNWGLGHATRCIPIINNYVNKGFRVVIAGDGASLKLLQNEFPNLETLSIKGINVRYSKNGMSSLSLLRQLPSFFWHTWIEHQFLKKVIKRYQPQLIISDNRYGFYNKNVKSILITHQLNPILPRWLNFTAFIFHPALHWLINRFSECWVPDYKGSQSLAGDLSMKHPRLKNIKYIGPLSRFFQWNPDKSDSILPNCNPQFSPHLNIASTPLSLTPKIVALVSGPEPQRGILDKQLTEVLSNLNESSLLLKGLPSQHIIKHHNKLTVVNHLSSAELFPILNQCKVVICRSGYSSVMDMVLFGKKCIIIPTPKQTEQEYLCKYLNNKYKFHTVTHIDSEFYSQIKQLINSQ